MANDRNGESVKGDASEQTQSMTARTLRGFAWTSFGMTGRYGIQLLLSIVLARLLNPHQFGVVSLAMVVVTFAEFFTQLGLSAAIVQRKELTEKHLETAFTFAICQGVLLAGAAIPLAPYIASLFRMPELTSILRVLAPIFILDSMASVGMAMLQRTMRFRVLAGRHVLSFAIGYGCIGVPLAFYGFGSWALVWAAVSQTLVECTLVLRLQSFPKRLRFHRAELRDLLSYGSGIALGKVANMFAQKGDNLVVARMLGADALGIYGRAYNLMVMPADAYGQVMRMVFLPALARVQDDEKRFTNAYRRALSLSALLNFPLSAGLLMLTPEFVAVLLGPKWMGVVTPLQVLAFAMVFRSSYKISVTAAPAKGAVFHLAVLQYVYCGMVIIGSLIGYRYGVTGVAVAAVVSIIVHYVLLAQLCLKMTQLGVRDFIMVQMPGFLLGVATGVASLLVATLLRDFAQPPLAVLVGGAAAGGAALLLAVLAIPRWTLGPEGIWWLQTAAEMVPPRLPAAAFIRSSLYWLTAGEPTPGKKKTEKPPRLDSSLPPAADVSGTVQ